MARPRKPIHIDKGVKIFLRPNSPCWQIQMWRGNHRTCLSLKTTDVEAAKAIARQRVDEEYSESEGILPRGKASYERLLENYKRHAELRNKKTTQELNFRNLEHVAGFLMKRLKANRALLATDFSVAAIEAYAAARKKLGRKPDTINRELGTLSVLFNKARKARLVRANPLVDVERIPVARNQVPRTLSDSEVERLLRAAKDPVDFHGRGKKGKGRSRSRYTPLYHLLLFLLNSGARLAEALWFEFTDINFEEGLIYLSNKDDHSIKTRKQRAVRGNEVLMQMLRQRRMRQGDCPWVFPGVTGDQLDRRNLLRELKGAANRAGFASKRVNFLVVRHTALTASAKKGAPPFVLKELAGHATIRTTERYYVGRMGSGDWVPPSMGS